MELKFKPIRLPLKSVTLFSISDIFDFSEPSIITFLILNELFSKLGNFKNTNIAIREMNIKEKETIFII